MNRAGVAEVVVRTITEILPDVPAGAVREDRSLRDLGADSVERVEIITLLTHRLGRTDPLSGFAAIPDLGALIDHLSQEELQ
ncbi:putative acyl carrier protein [Actinoplanes missouriensis 431]|uniref:Putative acyl carrier protein n=1 Tax=Actinoplanes missouriensis (strain ATCC 14538 / DSM 43046 / CBS 188.64 / JCM 3121 / NBRC 102363 / NCIMB 12654 / NRRL B-3342 / UNCC 431) TaxID=512565 RepID=I0HB72_ACTM4|nr:phosphopantetheine-binding protein [Actinoplanes missouriensis]BAL90259.1 putative acyl carrier protein [Actinoplanes missouriensis 431]